MTINFKQLLISQFPNNILTAIQIEKFGPSGVDVKSLESFYRDMCRMPKSNFESSLKFIFHIRSLEKNGMAWTKYVCLDRGGFHAAFSTKGIPKYQEREKQREAPLPL